MELQENLSDKPKIMEKFSQPAGESGHALLPGMPHAANPWVAQGNHESIR